MRSGYGALEGILSIVGLPASDASKKGSSVRSGGSDSESSDASVRERKRGGAAPTDPYRDDEGLSTLLPAASVVVVATTSLGRQAGFGPVYSLTAVLTPSSLSHRARHTAPCSSVAHWRCVRNRPNLIYCRL